MLSPGVARHRALVAKGQAVKRFGAQIADWGIERPGVSLWVRVEWLEQGALLDVREHNFFGARVAKVCVLTCEASLPGVINGRGGRVSWRRYGERSLRRRARVRNEPA